MLPNPKDYDISPATGFLPSSFPLARLDDPYYAPWETLMDLLPALILNKTVRQYVDALPLLSTDRLGSETERRRAYVVLAFLSHAYVWAFMAAPASVLPAQIAEPFRIVADQLGLPPVATYAAVVLWNVQPAIKQRPFEEDGPALNVPSNLSAINTFTGLIDEQWFYIISALFEIEGAECINVGMRALEAAHADDLGAVVSKLQKLAELLDKLGSTLMQMEDMCDPYVFYYRIRPFLAGWKGMTQFGLDGVLYDGKNPKKYALSGGSNAQSSLIQFFDTLLNVQHLPTGTRPNTSTVALEGTKSEIHSSENNFMTEMTLYMPKKHREFLEALSKANILKLYVRANKSEGELVLAYDACLAMLKAFRDKHIQIVTRYIIIPLKMPNNTKTARIGLLLAEKGGARGTGGTALLPFLKQCRDETGDPAAGTWGQRILSDGILTLKYSKKASKGEENQK